MKAMREDDPGLEIRRQTQLSWQDIARQLNPLLRGWIEYYGRYSPLGAVSPAAVRQSDATGWVMRKFKRFKGHKIQASQFLERLARSALISSYTGNRDERHVCLMGAE